MATYTYGDPPSTSIDFVRLYAQITDVSNAAATAIYSNEELTVFLNRNAGNVYLAAANALEGQASTYSRQEGAETSGDGQSVDYKGATKALLDSAARLRELAGGGVAISFR